MKKIFIISLSVTLMFSACKTLKHIPGYDVLLGIDLRPYAEKGFLITPHVYAGDYISIYMIDYIIMPEGNYVPGETDGLGAGQTQSEVWVFEEINIAAAVDSIYNMSIEMGADAIMDFEIAPYEFDWKIMPNPVTQQGYEITGLAIKRGD